MRLIDVIKRVFPSQLLSLMKAPIEASRAIKEIKYLIAMLQASNFQSSHPNPLNGFGKKCFSQADEDGITIEILRRIKCLDGGTFAEFGVGDGTENNTLILKSLGWKGFWVGGEDLAFEINNTDRAFLYRKEWITLENIVDLANGALEAIAAKDLDVISLDLDGNDIYFVERLLSSGLCPKLFIVEYNAKFPPPVKWQVDYDAKHKWQGDDYFGASLASFTDLFEKNKYKLVCCNSHTGANAFYVRDEFSGDFTDVPLDIDRIYVPPRYSLYQSVGHKNSVRTIEKIFR